MTNLLGILMMALGLLSMLTAVVGMLRFPHLRMRIHAASINDTAGVFFTLLGFAVYYHISWQLFVKTILLIVIMAITNTAASHVIAHMAIRLDNQKKPYSKQVKRMK